MKKIIAITLLIAIILSAGVITASASNNQRHTFSCDLMICTSGGRIDIDMGNRNFTRSLDARFSRNVRVIMYDSSWNEVWSGYFSGSAWQILNPFSFHVIRAGANVRHVSFFLDDNVTAAIRASR